MLRKHADSTTNAEELLANIQSSVRQQIASHTLASDALRQWLTQGISTEESRRSLQWLTSADNRHFITRHNAHWPAAFEGMSSTPLALYAEGDLDLLCHPQLAMVGSRNPTPSGGQIAQRFARSLAKSGLGIVSGLAAGIDTCAHLGALAADGITIAVCGRGLDDTYPASNRGLARQIAATGLLLSEYTPGTAPARSHFPARNRIIAALGRGTLVVEATPRSGSLITAKQAAQFGREVFAVPGPIDSPLSRGCHQLIREGAHLVESPADIVQVIGPELLELIESGASESIARAQAQTFDLPAIETTTDITQQQLLDALDQTPVSLDTLVARTQFSAAEISSMLLILELQGTVAIAPGGGYQKVTKPN